MYQILITAIVSFVAGVLVGWTLGRTERISESHIRHVVAISMLVLYAISVVAEIQIGGYQTPMLLHAIMGGITGYLFSKGDGFNINIGQRQDER